MLSLGLSTVVSAKDGDTTSERRRDERASSRGRSGSNRERESGPKLSYDGKTSGFGSRVGGHLGGLAGSALGEKYGRTGGMVGESIAGAEIGSKMGDRLERNGNRIAHDKWNNKGRNDRGYGGGWRFSLDEDEDYEQH